LTIALMQSGLAKSLSQEIQGQLFRWRGGQPWDDRLVLVNIDQASLDQLVWFPWSRDRHSDLLEQLSRSENNVVVFDLVFSEATPLDSGLAKAMEQHGQVVLSRAWNRRGEPWNPTAQLAEAAIALGDITHFAPTERLAYAPAALEIQGFPSLALVAVQAYRITGHGLTGQAIPELPQASQPLRINWPGPAKQLTQYSFADVRAGLVSPEMFDNKIVLVGITAEGIDSLRTPFNPLGNASGIHFHGAMIHTLLQDSGLRPLPQVVQGLWGLLLGPVLGTVLVRLVMPSQLAVTVVAMGIWLILC